MEAGSPDIAEKESGIGWPPPEGGMIDRSLKK
jgi:hypothetical protein